MSRGSTAGAPRPGLLGLPLLRRLTGSARAPPVVPPVQLIGDAAPAVQDAGKAGLAELGLPADTQLSWYLGIGSNLHRGVFEGRRGIAPIETHVARLRGHALVMDLPGLPWVEPSFASVQPCVHQLRQARRQRSGAGTAAGGGAGKAELETPSGKNDDATPQEWAELLRDAELVDLASRTAADAQCDCVVYGAVFRITAAQLAHIRATEGGGASGGWYVARRVAVETFDVATETKGVDLVADVLSTDPAVALSTASQRLNPPSQRYLKIIADGAEQRGLPTAWVNQVRGWQGTPARTPYFWCVRAPILAILLVLVLIPALLVGLLAGLCGGNATSARMTIIRLGLHAFHPVRWVEHQLRAAFGAEPRYPPPVGTGSLSMNPRQKES